MKTPEIGHPSDDLPLSVVHSKYFPTFSKETIERWCRTKVFKTAYKPGQRSRSPWRVKRAEVIAHTYNSSVEFLPTN